ncbi:MAG: 50S ribosomal protein L4 [Candidatus Falkowbacteria bacterium]|nr:50S ribosomal protein L4 [Candidatus Falkowbacteria bacterium]
MKIKVYNQSAEAVKDLELSAKIFGIKPNNELLHQAVIASQANSRQVLAHTKDRSEVSGGGKKPWKQKGTGRARVGSSRSPIWIGGGVTFGPRKDRNFKQKINQKMKQKALFMALSDKVATGTLAVLDNLDFSDYKTKNFNAMLTAVEKKILMNDRRDILVINDSKNAKTQCSGRNLPGVKLIHLENINLLDILNYKNLLVTENAVKTLADHYSQDLK